MLIERRFDERNDKQIINNIDEINKRCLESINNLRELLHPKVDYADLVCAEGFAYGYHYVWEDPEPYIIENAANLINELRALINESL